MASSQRSSVESCALIEARNISVAIDSKNLLDDVSLRLEAGEVLVVVGQNGAGKSTLRRVLSGDLSPSSGEVWMNNRPLAAWSLPERAKVRAVLPQDSALSFPFTVLEVVLMGRAPHLNGAESKHDYQIARASLAAVEAGHLEDRIYPTLSGGERQRVHLARVLAQIWESSGAQTRYLILDEPISNVDIAHQHQILSIARNLALRQVAVLVILHDLNLAAQYADKIAMLKNGRIVALDTPDKILTPQLIEETFGVAVGVVKHPYFSCPLIIWRND